MTAYAVTAPVRPLEVRPRHRQVRTRVPAGQVYAVQTPQARARRKAVVRVAFIGAVLAVLAAVAPGAIAGDEPAPAVAHDTYTVAQGETLWSIASSLTAPGDQVRETMVRLQNLNAMGGSSLQAGEQIVIPALDR